MAEQLYNLEQLESIGDPEFVERMVSIFIREASSASEKIRQCYETGDFQTIKFLAHRIRPSLNNLGIQTMKEVTIEMEDLASQNKKDSRFENLINTFSDVISRVVAQLKNRHSVE